MSIFDFFKRKKRPVIAQAAPLRSIPQQSKPAIAPTPSHDPKSPHIRRYFHNEHGFQCYTSWFAHWGGWVSAGHCVTEAQDHTPDFMSGKVISWPDGLDAALVGCTLPKTKPASPYVGQDIIMSGFPAGCRTMERRTGQVYFERMPGQWIAHIFEPDEPVVTGMSGGPVIDAKTGEPIGIIITRNSPADLNNDRDPDESADFIALSDVWDAVKKNQA